MKAIPSIINDFLSSHYVLSLVTCQNNTPWGANCFYVFEETSQCLFIMSSAKTLHAQQMLINPQVAGTISSQTQSFGEIAGLQFTAIAECLNTPDKRKCAMEQYTKKYPIAKLAKFANTEIWALHLTKLKYTENKTIFAQKTIWEK